MLCPNQIENVDIFSFFPLPNHIRSSEVELPKKTTFVHIHIHVTVIIFCVIMEIFCNSYDTWTKQTFRLSWIIQAHCVLSLLFKIAEKLILKRIFHVIEANLPNTQFGFHSTIHQIHRLVDEIPYSLQKNLYAKVHFSMWPRHLIELGTKALSSILSLSFHPIFIY